MSDPALREAAGETARLAQLLEALKALSRRQADLPADDGKAWLDLQPRKQALCDDLAAISAPDLFLSLADLVRPAQGDDADTSAARRRLAQQAEAAIAVFGEIAACEAEAARRLAQGLRGFKEKATARRRGKALHRAYAAPASPQPRFLDARE